MKRATSLTAITAAGLILTLSSAVSTSASSADPTPVPSAPAAAKGPTSWTKISQGSLPASNEPGVYRTSNGVLHVAYGTSGGSLNYTNVSKHGKLLGRGTVVSGWDTIASDPKLIGTPDNGIRVVFDGVDLNGGTPYDEGRLYSATAATSGTDWSLAPGAMSYQVSQGYGTAAVELPGQDPIAAFANGNHDIFWRQSDGSTTPTTEDTHISNGDCCAYNTALARDAKTDRVILGWYSSGSTARTNGIFVQEIESFGDATKVKAPGSSRGPNSVATDQTVALSGRHNASGVYAAYCTGYPTCKQIRLWRVGSDQTIGVPKSADAARIAIAPGPQGRMWVAWTKSGSNKVFATLSNAKANRFGPARVVKAPKPNTYGLAATSGAVRHLDLVLTTGTGLYHRQLLPGLKLTAKPQRFHNNKRHVVTFRVTDAGAPVGGATVRVAGKTKHTGAQGKVSVVFRKDIKPKRYHATATRSGYARGHVNVRVLR